MNIPTILALIGLVVIIGCTAGLYFWAFDSGQVPLTADGIVLFDSQKALAERYGYIGRTYTAALPSWPEEAHPTEGMPTRADGFDHYFRIRFATERPASVVRTDELAEWNRVRAQKGKRTWNTAALNKAQLYMIGADIDMTGGKREHAHPDVTMLQAQDDLLSSLKAAFQNGGAALGVDPGDPHVLTVAVEADTGAVAAGTRITKSKSLTMKFSDDWKQANISIPDVAGGSITVTATTLDNIPEGPYIVKLATSGLVNVTSTPDYMFSRLNDKGLINPTIYAYFHKDGDFAGKAYFAGNNKTYKFHAATRDGALKLFLGDDAVLSIDPQRPTPSLTRYDGLSSLSIFISYTATIEKADVHGKEQQLAANFSALGSVPESVIGAPNVWGTYFDLSQRRYTAKEIIADPVLRQVFGHPQQLATDAGGSIALEIAAKHRARPTALQAHALPMRIAHLPTAPAVDPNRPKTDAEIEKEMQQEYKRRRY